MKLKRVKVRAADLRNNQRLWCVHDAKSIPGRKHPGLLSVTVDKIISRLSKDCAHVRIHYYHQDAMTWSITAQRLITDADNRIIYFRKERQARKYLRKVTSF